MAIDLYEIYHVLDMDRIYTLSILLSWYSALGRKVLKSGIHAMPLITYCSCFHGRAPEVGQYGAENKSIASCNVVGQWQSVCVPV